MATQLITVVGFVGKVDPGKMETLCSSPGRLPTIYYSQWIDNWTPMLQLVELLNPRVQRQRIVKFNRVRFILSERNQRYFQNLLATMRRTKRDPNVFKLIQEIAQALHCIMQWKGKVAVMIQLLDSSIYDEDISAFLKLNNKHVRTNRKRRKNSSSMLTCRVDL